MDNNELNNNGLNNNLGDQILMGNTEPMPNLQPEQPKNNLNMNQGLNTVIQNNLNQNKPVEPVAPQQPTPIQPEVKNETTDNIFTDIPESTQVNQIQPEQVNEEPSITPEVPKQKKGKGPIILIVILLLVILGLAGYIAYDKFFTKEEPKKVVSTPTKKETNTEDTETTKTKQKDDYYIKLEIDKETDYLDKTIGSFVIDGKSNDVKISRKTEKVEGVVDNQTQENYVISIGDYIFKYPYVEYGGLPDWIAVMDEKYVALFFQGASLNEIILYDLSGNRIESFGNSLGEVDNKENVIDELIIDDKNFNYYECKLNNGPGTETLSEYNVIFKDGKYTKELLSTKKNTTCLSGA